MRALTSLEVKMSPAVKLINSAFKESIVPILKEAGFNKFSGKKAWKHFENKIYLFQVSGVGAHFSSVTGYPASSLTASINIYYIGLPDSVQCKKIDKSGILLPGETECNYRFGLDKNVSQKDLMSSISFDVERRDIWWVNQDGSNVTEVIDDLKTTLESHALSLVERPHYSYEAQVASHAS